MEQRVVCAANRHPETKQIILGARHWDQFMHQQADAIGGEWAGAEQGFIDQMGGFLTREEAWVIAESAGQIVRRVGGDGSRLFSENMY